MLFLLNCCITRSLVAGYGRPASVDGAADRGVYERTARLAVARVTGQFERVDMQ